MKHFVEGLLIVVAAMTYPSSAVAAKGKKSPPFMIVQFGDASGDGITSDASGVYADGRSNVTGGNLGVEAFLFESGNLGLRLEDSSRRLVLDFSNGPGDGCSGACDELPDDLKGSPASIAVSELNNNPRILLPPLCNGDSPGGSSKGPKGLLCLANVGDEVDSQLSITWTGEQGRRFSLDMLSNDSDARVAPIRIERVAPPADPYFAGRKTWVFTPTGAARLTSTARNGRQKQDHGVFFLPFTLTTACVDPECN